MKDGGSIDPSTVWERSNRCEVVSLTVTGTNSYDCDAVTCPCSENPPKTRTQKPNTGGVRMLQKQVFRIHWSSEHVGAAKGKAPFAGGAPVLAVHRRPAICLLSIRVPASTTAFRPG